MEELYDKIRCRFASVGRDNSGVAAVEVILILVDIFIFNYICVSSI